jgi:hypothetical protein
MEHVVRWSDLSGMQLTAPQDPDDLFGTIAEEQPVVV